MNDPIELCRQAFHADDAQAMRELLERHPALKARINDPIGPFDSPVITNVRSRAMLDVLLAAGADINGRSHWWAGSFGLLDHASPELAAYAIERGAIVDVHSAARLGMMEKLREMVSQNPALVHARGGDGQMPLHFAGSIEIAAYLLDHGAEMDVRDIDHESTAAQWMIRDRQDVARFLVQRGCKTDILTAAALGDADLVRRKLDENPACIRMRVSPEYFPMANARAGGTIYQWTLGFHCSPHEVAKNFGHEEVFRLLMERSPADVKLLAACWTDDEPAVRSLIQAQPNLAASVSEGDRRQVADAARNNNLSAVRLMLVAGLPVDARGQHGATPLHWAAWHGNAELVKLILQHNPPLELTDRDFHAPPLGWAAHGSENGWHCETGDYAAVVNALIDAGAKLPDKVGGSEAVRQALRVRGVAA